MDGRVLIADGNPLAASPDWDRYDTLPLCKWAGSDITTGRSTVFERTDVGTATVHFEDRDHTLNSDSLVGRAIQLQILNPVTNVWESSYRGVVGGASYDVYPLTQGLVTTTQLQCFDLFSFLSRVEMNPGRFGHNPMLPSSAAEAKELRGAVTFIPQKVQERIKSLLMGTASVPYLDQSYVGLTPGEWPQQPDGYEGPTPNKGSAGLPDALVVVFTGNVWVWDAMYSPGESVLTAMRDAADAEFPGVANILCDRKGRICFHGRRSRFDPEAVVPGGDWTFTRWAAGDSVAVAAGPPAGHVGVAQVRALAYDRETSLVYNQASAWPEWRKPSDKQIAQAAKLGYLAFAAKFPVDQAVTQVNNTSQNTFGLRAMPTMSDLQVMKNFNNDNLGEVECQLYSAYFVNNYNAVHPIPVVSFKTMHPADPRAAANWRLLTQIEISDIIRLTVGAAEMSAQDYFVEGWSKEIRPMTGTYDYVELRPNLSSVARYANSAGLFD